MVSNAMLISGAQSNLPCNIMVSAAGRRVELLRCLQQSLEQLGVGGEVIASDIVLTAPAMQTARRRVLVPRYSHPNCLEQLLKIVRENEIRLIVPTIDTELSFYAQNAAAFGSVGCTIGVGKPQVIEICGDKVATHQFLTTHRFPTVQQCTLEEAIAGRHFDERASFVKPRFGSASIGAAAATSRLHLEVRSGERDLIVQSIAPGREYTVDVYVDRNGKCRCTVPRLRLETRGGEVSKGLTVRNRPMMELAGHIAERLPGAWGVINMQIFRDDTSGEMNVIEINPRFGGGYPLADHAGARMGQWLIQETLGLPLTASPDCWRDGLAMLRYDEAVFVSAADAGLNVPGVL